MKHVITTPYGAEALERLREVVGEAKAEDRMATVSVLVPNGTAGVVARRHLARFGNDGLPGIAGVRFSTLPRLAEELAAGALAPRRPTTRTVLAAAWRSALRRDAGQFALVGAHAATIEALVRAHHELRDLDEEALAAVATTGPIQQDVVRLHRSVVERLSPDWYDASDLLRAAARLPDLAGRVRGLVVLYLPQALSHGEQAFAAALERALDLTVIVGVTGEVDADQEVLDSINESSQRALDVSRPLADAALSSSDSDDEVRCVGRAVLADLESTPAHRIAVLYAAADPYAQTLHERFEAMGVVVNGAGVRSTADRPVARALLELLALLERDVPRGDLFRALANVQSFDFGGARIPLTQWERVSREAGVVGGDDWADRLERFAASRRAELRKEQREAEPKPWRLEQLAERIATAEALSSFAIELRKRLRAASAMRSWPDLAGFAVDLFQLVAPERAIAKMPRVEQQAVARILAVLRGVTSLAEIEPDASFEMLRDALQLELDAVPPRVGTFGNGVLVAPISAGIGLDLDRVYLVGLAEDLYPGRLHEDALLPEVVRANPATRLPALLRPLNDRFRSLLAAMQSATHVTVSMPRGDLRRSTHRLPSRWMIRSLRALEGRASLSLTEWDELEEHAGAVRFSSSFGSELLSTPQPADEQEWRTQAVAASTPVLDPALRDARRLLLGRSGEAFTVFDGNLSGVAGLPDLLAPDSLISPTSLEDYATCPHAFFMRRMLRVQPLEQPEDIVSIRSVDVGTFIHESLEELAVQVQGELPQHGEPWTTAQRELLRQIGEKKADEFEKLGLTGHRRLWIAERARLLNDLARTLDEDDRIRGERAARVHASELTFGMNGADPLSISVPGGSVRLSGSADRVDVGADGTVYVVDFKTGSSSRYADIKPANPLANGTKLQLPAYAHAARLAVGTAVDVQAEYLFVRKGMGRISVPLADVEEAFSETLALLARSIAAGVFPQHPPKDDDHGWVRCVYCNPDGRGYVDGRDRWASKRRDPRLVEYVGLVEGGVSA